MIKDIVFDFGGVLTTIDPNVALQRFAALGVNNPGEMINSYCQKGAFFALENGDITAVSANALKINKIARDTASISQSNLKNLSLNGIPVPLGALTGIEAFAGLGPSIHFRIIPVSSVTCGFSSSFESVGINQTKHSIYLNVLVDISIVMPSRTENFAVTTDILVGESVIIGAIPDTYLQSDIFGNKGNLSP